MMQPTVRRGEPARATPGYEIRPEAAAAIRAFVTGAVYGIAIYAVVSRSSPWRDLVSHDGNESR